MIVAASVETGELGPVVVSISHSGGRYFHHYRDFDTDQEAINYYESLGPEDDIAVEDGRVYIKGRPDGFQMNVNDDGGYARLFYGEQEITRIAGKERIVEISERVIGMLK